MVFGHVQPAGDALHDTLNNSLLTLNAVDRTAGPHRGRIYVVWDEAPSGDPDVFLSFSDDRGDTWSTYLATSTDGGLTFGATTRP